VQTLIPDACNFHRDSGWYDEIREWRRIVMEETTEGHINPEQHEEIFLPEPEDWYCEVGGEA
jgi:hypothetical protein